MSCKQLIILILVLCINVNNEVYSQNQPAKADSVAFVSFGDMNQWLTREVKESFVIGGDTKTLYEIAPKSHIRSNKAYVNQGGSPWATSNVMAKVSGVTKTNASVFPVKHKDGYAAHLVTRIEKVEVLGLIDIEVLAAGSLYLGSVVEPIKSAKNPYSVINFGVPFNQRPKAIRFDYKVHMSGEDSSIRLSGFGGADTIRMIDKPTAIVLLQKRWETPEGKIMAKRVGTYIIEYDKSCEWKYDNTYNIIYGDATINPDYKEYMGLNYVERNALNSRQECVQIEEIGWAENDEQPTHIIIQFSSSNGGAYVGSPNNQMWVDNIRLVY